MTVDLTPTDDRPPVPEPAPDGAQGPPGAAVPDMSPAPPPVPDVSEDQVRGILRLIGAGAHTALGHPAIEEHWRFTDAELDQLTPPVTTWINRNPRLRAAAAHGDAATVAIALGMYASRNISISREIAAAEEEQAAAEEEQAAAEVPGPQPWSEIP